MGKSAGIAGGLVAIALLAGFAIRAVVGPEGDERPHQITVSGASSVSSAPDQAIVSMGVRVEGEDPESAFQAKSARVNAVMDSLGDAGIGRDDISTTDLSLDRRVRDRGTPRETVTYIAENRMDVTVRELEKVGEMVDRAVTAGANVVGGVEFRLSDQSGARDEALQKAVNAAREKAETLAEAAGASLGGVVRIEETRSDFDSVVRNQLAPAAFDAAGETKVVPEEVETSVNVLVIWELD
ncbi:MAG: SIMPL domain-containing protein [Actinomycetota bacterium]